MRRLTILLAALGALLLLPAAQAFAEGTLHVNVAGSGHGEVSSVGGIGAFKSESAELSELFEGFGSANEGSPPIQCSGPPSAGTCATELEGELESIGLHAAAAPGSEFAGWVINEGGAAAGCEVGGPLTAEGENPSYCAPDPIFINDNAEVTATFNKSGPTNRVALTITKNANGPGGLGSVSSKPKGIKCGANCSEAVAKMFKGTPVELTEKPGKGSTFSHWSGACSGSLPTCTVLMAAAESVEAVFSSSSEKALNPGEALKVEKTGSGFGTVKAAGLGCEAECSQTTVLYQGPITGSKPKPGKLVILKQAPAFGSEFSGWSGCKAEPEGNCEVEMAEAEEVSAEYTALPTKTLTVNKHYSTTGNGSVSSKPKGIKCGATCNQAVAAMPQGASVELAAKPGSGGAFVEWVGGDCGGSHSPTCTVTMNTNETTEAVFSTAGKALSPEETLTLTKEGSGFGTVKASGLACEALCTETAAVFQGPVSLPKPKPGKLVVLTAVSAAGSQPVVWTGCEEEPVVLGKGKECVVTMEAATAVTATFEEVE